MNLQNLFRIGRIKEHPVNAAEIQKLLTAARRNLQDSLITEISPESRFDIAYKAIMQSALAAMMAKGYRPNTNSPGHHQTVLQSLPITMGLANERMLVLDALRRRRNLSDYTGEDVDDALTVTCTEEAGQLLEDVTSWLALTCPGLIG